MRTVQHFIKKCLTEKKRQKFRNIVITFIPLVVLIFLLKSNQQNQTIRRDESAYGEQELKNILSSERIIRSYYTPNTILTANIMEYVRRIIYSVDERLEPVATEQMMEYIVRDNEHNCFGINFSKVSDDGLLEYTIRMKNNNFHTEQTYSRDVFNAYKIRNNEYIQSGFLALQNAIDRAHIFCLQRTRSGDDIKTPHPTLHYGHIPVVESPNIKDSNSAFYTVVWTLACSTFQSVYLLLLPLVEERANGAKEYLKIVCSASYWNEVTLLSIALFHFFIVFLTSVVYCLFIDVWETNPAQVFCLILLGLLYLIHLIAFIFFLSTTLESSTIAAAVAPVCLFSSVLVSYIFESLTLPLCVFPANGWLTGGLIFVSYKSSGHLFEAQDLLNNSYPSLEGYNLLSVYLMQVCGIILWLFLGFYVTNVFPGQYGTPKSKGFFLSKNYWRRARGTRGKQVKPLACLTKMIKDNKGHWNTGREQYSNSTMVLHGHNRAEKTTTMNSVDSMFLETPIPDGVEQQAVGKQVKPLVRIRKLNKVYKGRWNTGREKVAVKDFSLSIYSNSITVLLGHNGAGKTTTMNIITGMVPCTSGSIIVDGEQDSDRYRPQIGFCPQHNVFYSFLNCREHVEFFGCLRGLSLEDARKEAVDVMEKVNLMDKSEAFVHTLSGGMKRRLSLANAIIGNTKLLILDEPTSGLDPESRRDIWDLLLKLRKDHTILLTTHFIEEADILSDWIAIMEYGELVAFGTPLLLKQRYGKGYTLKLLKGPEFDAVGTWRLVQRHVSKATVRESVNDVFSITLPYESLEQYPALLNTLETNQKDRGIEAISMSNASLEEVFLNSSKSNKRFQHHPKSEVRADSPIRMPSTSSTTVKRASNLLSRATLNIGWAIWRKKAIHMQCNKHIYGALLLLPVIVMFICCMTTGHTAGAMGVAAVRLDATKILNARGVIAINSFSPHNGETQSLFRTILKNTTFEGVDLLVRENISLIELLNNEIRKDYTKYRDEVVVGIECNHTKDGLEMTILHNNNLVHSTGIGQSIATTILMRYYFEYSNAKVEVQNVPSTRKLLTDVATPYYVTELVSMAYMFYILLYLQLPLLEHQTGFRQLQNINRYVYWSSTYLFDILLHTAITTLVVVLPLITDRGNVFSSAAYMHIFAALLLYGVQALLVVYIISKCVEHAITIMSYLMIIGVCGVVLLSSGYDDIQNNSTLILLLHLVPEFALKHSMRVIYENEKLNVYKLHSSKIEAEDNKPLSLVKLYVAPLVVVPILVLILNEVVEHIYRRENIAKFKNCSILRSMFKNNKSWRRRSRTSSGMELHDAAEGLDEADSVFLQNVKEESEMVDKLLETTTNVRDQYAVVVKKLEKKYIPEHKAVKQISFAVKRGECFGLLGMNGAGKTTVFQMLSRNLPISDGQIYLQHCEVQKANPLEYRDQHGYCPQIDMLLDFLTVYQTIDYCASIKNIQDRKKHIIHWLTVLDILAYKDHAVGECSGGTKRKVNTILALLGGPSVVLLDEPTTGVDPKSRRFLWKCIKDIQQDDQTILLTSHSMEECEKLCNRLAIMVDGTLRCIGSILELKSNLGQGYNILIKLKNTLLMDDADNYESLITEIKRRLNASLKDKHEDTLKFAVNPPVMLSQLFGKVNQLKEAHDEAIESYSINETSRQEIFKARNRRQGLLEATQRPGGSVV